MLSNFWPCANIATPISFFYILHLHISPRAATAIEEMAEDLSKIASFVHVDVDELSVRDAARTTARLRGSDPTKHEYFATPQKN